MFISPVFKMTAQLCTEGQQAGYPSPVSFAITESLCGHSGHKTHVIPSPIQIQSVDHAWRIKQQVKNVCLWLQQSQLC